MLLNISLLTKAPCATWFMVGRHDLFMNNERDEILAKYGQRVIRKFVGIHFSVADTVKIELE